MSDFDMLCCGSATVDVFATTNKAIKVIKEHGVGREHMVYPCGSKIIIDALFQAVGGGGTNSAVAASRLGLSTGYVGCIGKDSNAHTVLDVLAKEQVSFLGHYAPDITGYSVVLDSSGHDRTILAYKGANNAFVFHKKQFAHVNTKAVYCSSMVGPGFAAQKKLIAHFKAKKALIAYNPSSYHVQQGLASLRPLLRMLDVLIFNKEEAEILLKVKEPTPAKTLLQGLVKYVPTIVITDGPHCIYAVHENTYVELRPQKVHIEETTGAGDAFASTFVASLVQSQSFETSLHAGLVNAQSVIGHIGAKRGLVSKTKMKRLLKDTFSLKNHGHLV